MNLTEIDIQRAMKTLPDNVSHAISVFDWGNEVMSIAKKHRLQVENIGIFRNETLAVILGLSPADTYHQNLVKKMGINDALADTLISEANQNIFSRLQRMSFPSKEIDDSDEYKDDYYELEPIDHSDLAGIMRDAGIELVEEFQPSELVHRGLHDEVSSILGNEDNSYKPNTAPRDKSLYSMSEGIKADPEPSEVPSTYLEEIEPSDMKGSKNRPIDVSILKKNSQFQPNKIFEESTSLFDNMQRNLGQSKILDQSLDKHIMENPFMAKGDIIDASPSESEVIKEEIGFLNHLSQKEE